MPESRDFWSKLSIVGTVIAAPLLTAAVAFVGSEFARRTQNRETEVKIMQVATSILALDQKYTGNGIRDWAWDVLALYSGVQIPTKAREQVPGPLPGLGVVQVSPSPDKLSDSYVFVCHGNPEDPLYSDEVILANLAADALKTAGFGRIETRVWKSTEEISVEELRGATTIVFDKGHPEEGDVPRIRKALEEKGGLPAVHTVPNKGPPTPWYYSIIVCK